MPGSLSVAWSIQTAPAGVGAVAVIGLTAVDGAQLDTALGRLGIGPVPVGAVGLRDIAGVDRGVVARWSDTAASLMPHASSAVIRRLTGVLGSVGGVCADPRRDYPEADGLLEAHMLGALARAASPMAVDLLIDQPRRWAAAGWHAPDALPASLAPDLDRIRARLIDPPLVAAWGPPNVGKSTLVNALAGRGVSIVADEPGTTRDHVGVLLDLAGLVVRYADTPGVREAADGVEADAFRIARDLVAAADLVLVVGDASAGPPPAPVPAGRTITVATRIDLGAPRWPRDVAVCAPEGRGLSDLVAAIRNRLAPPEALQDPRPWAFWATPDAPPT